MELSPIAAPLQSSGVEPGKPAIRRPVGILVSRFPLITETFILREIEELERQGQPVVLIPMIRENPDVVHEQARRWVGRAVAAPFLSPGVVWSFVETWFRQPGPMFDILVWILGKTLLHPRVLIRSLVLFPKSVHLASLIRQTDIRHLHAHFATHPTTMAVIIAWLTGVSFSFTAHAHDIFVDRTLLREKISNTQFVRSISTFNKAFLENLYPRASAGKIRVIHVGIEPELYRSEGETSQAGPARLLCIAAMKPYKGVPHLVEAARILRLGGVDFRLEIIGTGPLMRQIAQSVADLDLEDRIFLRGALPQDEVAEMIRAADIFVLPSVIASDGQMEGIPVALMEAMAAGKPVVATSISGIPELVDHGSSGLLVDPANPQQLADALRLLIEDPDLGKAFAEKGREKVENQFDLRAVVRELIAQFDRINPPMERAVPVPYIGREVVWGIRRSHMRSDSQVFEMMAAGHAGIEEVILKRQATRAGESLPAEDRAGREWHLLRELELHFAQVRADAIELGVPRAIGFDRLTATVAMERAGEHTLEDSIRKARRHESSAVEALETQMLAAGAWLRHFQSFDERLHAARCHSEAQRGIRVGEDVGELRHPDSSVAPEALHRNDREGSDFRCSDDAVTFPNIQLVRNRIEGPAGRALSSRERSRLRGRLSMMEADLGHSSRPAVAHHGDFWPGNVFVSDGNLRVIDFEGFRIALPSLDVAWFLLHTGLYLEFRATRLLELTQKRFLEGYQLTLDPSEMELSRIYSALLLLEKDDSRMSLPQRLVRRMYLRRELMR